MLDRWLQEAARAAGVDAEASLVSEDAVTVILDLARDAAHGVERPAAPLAAFVAGLAVAHGAGLDDLRSVAARISALADSWDEPG